MRKELKIKVCGMKHTDNIKEVSQLPIDYIGFIFYAKSPRYIEKPVHVPSPIQKVGIFVDEELSSILQKAAEYDLQVIQLHGSEKPELCQHLREQGLLVWKAFGIDDSFDWIALKPYLTVVDLFLFDTKSPKHGGTGQTFDWKKLTSYPDDIPYFLSGGLSLDNIAEAHLFEDERLIGLDLNSKFEIEPGVKNIDLLTEAFTKIKHEQISGRQ